MHGLAPQLGEIEEIATSVKATPPVADILICLPATLIAQAVQSSGGWIAIGGRMAARKFRARSPGTSARKC
jgi:triosephosphate isomerase